MLPSGTRLVAKLIMKVEGSVEADHRSQLERVRLLCRRKRTPAHSRARPTRPVRQSHGISLIGHDFLYIDCISFRRIGGAVAARGDRASLRFQIYRRRGHGLPADFPIARYEWTVGSASWRGNLHQHDARRAHKQGCVQLNRQFDTVTTTVSLVRISRYIAWDQESAIWPPDGELLECPA